jgi:hypothetical protein
LLRAGGHVQQTVSAVATQGRIETGAVVLNQEAHFAVAFVHSEGDEGSAAVAQGIAHGFPGDLQGLQALLRRQQARRIAVDRDVELG